MKKEIQIAVNLTSVNTQTRTIHFPTESKYYQRQDDSRFFGRGKIIFAMLETSRGQAISYYLVGVERNKQIITDFIPMKDSRQDTWIKSNSDENRLRKEAFEIITYNLDGYIEITKEEFETQRLELLNDYINRYQNQIV